MHRSKSATLSLSICSILLTTLACDSADTPEDEDLGEPVISFRGQVTGAQSRTGGSEPEVAVLWLTCPEDDNTCYFNGSGGGGGVSIPEDADPSDPNLHACIAGCESLPPCVPWVASSGFFGLMYCEEYVQCVDDCGGQVLWQTQLASRFFNGGISQPTAIEGDFPAAFTLNIYEAPAENLQRWTGVGLLNAAPEDQQVAMGFVIAKGPGDIDISPETGITGPVLGAAESQVIIYNEAEINPYNEVGHILELEQPLAPGFHIFDHHYEPCPPFPWGSHLESFRCGSRFSLSPMDINSEISVELGDASEINWPLLMRPGQP